MFPLTTEVLLAIMPNSAPVVADWVAPLSNAMESFGVTRGMRVPYFLANIAHESMELRDLEESFAYRPERLHAVFPSRVPSVEFAAALLAQGEAAVAEHLYGKRGGNHFPGDGWTYRARGPIGLTFRENYAECSIAICGDADTLLKNPEFLKDPEFGAASAAWYWDRAGCNEAADEGNFDAACDLVNIGKRTIARGDSNGFADREQYLKRALALA